MNELRGTLKTAMLLRVAYIECRNSVDFAKYCQHVFDMDEFTAGLVFEVIDAVGDLGVTPDKSHPIIERPDDADSFAKWPREKFYKP